MNQRSIEIRVGALLVGAGLVVVVLLLVLFSAGVRPSRHIYIDFRHVGAIESGSPLRVSNVPVGRVLSVELLPPHAEPPPANSRVLVRVHAAIDLRYVDRIHEDARFYVTTTSFLSQQFVAVDPGTVTRPVIEEGKVFYGEGPPELEVILSETAAVLNRVYEALHTDEQTFDETVQGIHAAVVAIGRALKDDPDRLDHALADAEALTSETRDAIRAARETFIDGPEAQRILGNLLTVSDAARAHLPGAMADGAVVARDARRATEHLARDEDLERYRRLAQDLGAFAQEARQISADGRVIFADLRAGKGTAGALLRDEAMYDDIQDLLRELKHNPWKLFWKE